MNYFYVKGVTVLDDKVILLRPYLSESKALLSIEILL